MEVARKLKMLETRYYKIIQCLKKEIARHKESTLKIIKLRAKHLYGNDLQ
jgi:hypothetical protein